MKKLTKAQKFQLLLEVVEVQSNETLVEFINHELELLSKKNATSQGTRKPTKTQLENEAFTEVIVEVLGDKEAKTITDLQQSHDALEPLTNQKISALLKKLVDSDVVEKYMEKKKTYFKMK